MTNNRKKGIRIAGALFIILLCALGYWTYRCLNPTREQVQAAKARIEAYSCYEIRRNGKPCCDSTKIPPHWQQPS